MPSKYTETYFAEVAAIAAQIDQEAVDAVAAILVSTRALRGRLFVLGVGGSAANAAHAVNDFRKLCAIEAYAPTDNVSELTARTNDDGWSTVFEAYLRTSRLHVQDAVLVLSVGGGSVDPPVSTGLVKALYYARKVGARIVGIVGRDGGHTKVVADACVVVPTQGLGARVTPHTEAFQAVVWHCLVTHPDLLRGTMKW